MGVWSNVSGWVDAHRRGLLRGGIVLVLAVAVIAVWRFGRPDKSSEQNIVAEWNETIQSLGIDPVFPPEEDLYVGDLLAVIVADRHAERVAAKKQPLLNRAIKLAHLDLSADLIENYKTLPLFPATTDRPGDVDKAWAEAPQPSGIFSPPDVRRVPAIAAFPGFTIHRQASQSGGLSSSLQGALGFAMQDSDDVLLKIPFVETYGLPSLLANYRLNLYCADPFNKDVCSDETLRRHLGFVTQGLFDTEINPETHQLRYVMDVELALVNRVYMTRAIEQKRARGGDRAASLDFGGQSVTLPNQAGSATPPSADPAAGGAPPSSKQIVDGSLVKSEGATPHGAASANSAWDADLELKETFERPVAFGYRAVKLHFLYDLNHPNLAPGQK
jgi:hypothetical protein